MSEPRLIGLFTPEQSRTEARNRARELLAGRLAGPIDELADGFAPLGTSGLEGALDVVEPMELGGDTHPTGAETLVLALATLGRGMVARRPAGAPDARWDAIWTRLLHAAAGLLARAPAEEGPWQGVLSQLGQLLGQHLAEQIVYISGRGGLAVEERRVRLQELQLVLEGVLDVATAPGRAGAVVGLHQIVQYANQQRNMQVLSDLAQGDPDDLVRAVARQALVRAMDANFDLVY